MTYPVEYDRRLREGKLYHQYKNGEVETEMQFGIRIRAQRLFNIREDLLGESNSVQDETIWTLEGKR